MNEHETKGNTKTIHGLLGLGRKIWGDDRLPLDKIIVRFGVGFGDICRVAREMPAGAQSHAWDGHKAELKKELGNIIFSVIRWCDDLGFTPDECIDAAIEAQQKFAASSKPR